MASPHSRTLTTTYTSARLHVCMTVEALAYRSHGCNFQVAQDRHLREGDADSVC